ncbi:SHOCT domain-containing protein, partial [Chloroflexota bacterium]
ELVTHDTRETFLNYFDEKNERHSLFFDKNAFQAFNDIIPEKEYHIVNTLKASNLIKSQTVTSKEKTITGQIRDLAKLKDEGIITEQEFNEKKKVLLDKIT